MNKLIKKITQSLFTVALLSSVVITNADDVDIINTQIPTKSNILFVMDMSGSMQYRLSSNDLPTGAEKSRKEVLHEALRTVLNDPQLLTLDINIGLASFAGNKATSINNQRGHGISYPVAPLLSDAATILDSNPLWDHQATFYDGENVTSYLPLAGLRSTGGYIGDVIPSGGGVPSAGWTPYGKTPIVEALYEAALYFRGATPVAGDEDPIHKNSAHPSSYTGLYYDKTVTAMVNQQQECNGSTGIPCDTTTMISNTTTTTGSCLASDASCQSSYTSATNGSCGAIITRPDTRCDLSACNNASPSCSTSSIHQITYPKTCELASEAACYASTAPVYDAGSCVARTIPEYVTPGPCLATDIEGACTNRGNPVTTPEETVYDCTVTEDRYWCPAEPIVNCSKDIVTFEHTIEVLQTSRTRHGGATYKSPITEECPSNSIILLSDGKPSRSYGTTASVVSMIGGFANGCSAVSGNDDDIDFAGRCGKELTSFLANTDNSPSVSGDQYITTHTIGLSLGASPDSLASKAYLEDLAFNGGGQFINASTPAGLVAALLNTITSNSKARSFASPTYVGSSSSMAHGEFVYVPVFDKDVGPVWPGNLKKYKRSGGRLIDADGLDATDPLGTLKVTARDFWSAVPSVNAVNSGGVANKIPDPDTRVLYTDAGAVGGINFSAATELKTSNMNITNALLGNPAMTATERAELIEYIRGKKSDGTARKHMGDIIHSKPVYVRYPGSDRLFIGTNEGYLHAIDEATGIEQFAFMPSLLLKNINTQFQNDALSTHVYGVDGSITLHHKDDNGDGIVNGADTAVLYFGLRRAEKAYYALDITDPAAPKLKWKIKQGAGDFNNLGYSWSKPVVAKMKHNSATAAEDVVVFGGGYVDDNGGEADNSGTGANVFIVKASDGSLIWKLSDFSNTTQTNGGVGLEHAVPGDVRVLDITRDGSLDRLYFADTGGNVWRVDFESNLTGTNSKKAKLKKFADLGGATPKRKFFTEPDVALFKANGRFLISVAIGSGQRPEPLNALTDDHFFMMFDTDVRQSPNSATPTITKAMLKDATSASVTNVLSGGKRGWYMDLVAVGAEKVLSRAVTYNNRILFNTFGASSVSAAACGANNVNQSRLYVLDIMTAKAVVDLDNDSNITPNSADDRSTLTGTGEIPGAPQIIFNEPVAKDGTPCKPGDCEREATINTGNKSNMVVIPSGGTGETVKKAYWIDKE